MLEACSSFCFMYSCISFQQCPRPSELGDIGDRSFVVAEEQLMRVGFSVGIKRLAAVAGSWSQDYHLT